MYNGVVYNNLFLTEIGLPHRFYWDDHYMYASVFGGAVLITGRLTYYSPERRTIQVERIRLLDLFDVSSIPGLFMIGIREDQSLLSIRGKELLVMQTFSEPDCVGRYRTIRTTASTYVEDRPAKTPSVHHKEAI
jgi:hypothetical protein